ncbi:hypothetical protein L1987_58725 [Smallanthus sonchifolius]|uniref:Uncharacterized protein n=1 Tax=Smallanthus sonchifolius TaxID=185202 RepID=A0ACB9D3L2_9ASTR|nr:hypothetical protein L1987_58725 [Smallanthus sonchifolius]
MVPKARPSGEVELDAISVTNPSPSPNDGFRQSLSGGTRTNNGLRLALGLDDGCAANASNNWDLKDCENSEADGVDFPAEIVPVEPDTFADEQERWKTPC